MEKSEVKLHTDVRRISQKSGVVTVTFRVLSLFVVTKCSYSKIESVTINYSSA
jgi:hypothetical protein